jgi:nucleotidyltransferase/DNA polymerase involved in DNA repair
MAQLGIETGLDLKGQTEGFLQHHFGKAGSYYYWAARGVDERPVRADRIRKSVGAENTFPADLLTYEAARDALREIAGKVWGYCEGSGMRGRTVTLKVKFANFQIITRSRTGQMPVRTRANSKSWATRCSNRFFRSGEVSGSSTSPCLHSLHRRRKANPNSACLPRPWFLGRG